MSPAEYQAFCPGANKLTHFWLDQSTIIPTTILPSYKTFSETLVAYFTKEVNPSLAKLPLNFNGSLAKLGLTSIVKQAMDDETSFLIKKKSSIHVWY